MYDYLENMKKLESLENTLIQQSLKLDQLEDDYEDTISYNENKIKTKSVRSAIDFLFLDAILKILLLFSRFNV